MGQLSKDILKKANILPKLKLGLKTDRGVATTGKHFVKLIGERLVKTKEYTSGKVIDGVQYIFEENGEQKEYVVPLKNKEDTKPHYFVIGMADIKEGDELVLEMTKAGVKNVINIQKVGEQNEIDVEEGHDGEDLETVNIDD